MNLETHQHKYYGLRCSLVEISELELSIIYNSLVTEKSRLLTCYKTVNDSTLPVSEKTRGIINAKYESLCELINIIEREKLNFI